jgi:hypothetical protein
MIAADACRWRPGALRAYPAVLRPPRTPGPTAGHRPGAVTRGNGVPKAAPGVGSGRLAAVVLSLASAEFGRQIERDAQSHPDPPSGVTKVSCIF